MPIRIHTPKFPARFSWAGATAWFYFILLVILLCLSAFLWKSGEMLMRADAPGHARWAAVLAGDGRDMERGEAAWALYQEGRFDSLILMGPRVFKTRHASEFEAELLETRGIPKDKLFQLPNEALSTTEEAGILIPQARLLGADTLLLITSSFHSARAGRIFRKLAGGYPVIRVYAADDFAFDPKAWWSFNESREIWLVEWLKTLNTAWSMWRQKPLVGSAEFMLLEPNPRVNEIPKADAVKVVPPKEKDPVPEPLKDSVKAEKRDTVVAAPVDSNKTEKDTAAKVEVKKAEKDSAKKMGSDSAGKKGKAKNSDSTAKPMGKSKKN